MPECPPRKTEELAKDLPDTFASTMNAMGIESCKTTQNSESWNMAAAGEMEIMGGLGGSASVAMNANGLKTGSSSVGCEQVLAIAKKNLDVVDKVKCTLQDTYLAISQAVSVMNEVAIDVGGNFEPVCDFTIDQQNKVTLAANITFSETAKQQMTDILDENIKDVTKALQESKSGYGATPEGAKMLEDINNKSIHGDYKADIKKIVETTSQLATENNKVTIKVRGDFKPGGKYCKISQSNIAEFVASILLNQTISQVFSDYGKKVNEYAVTHQQEAENAGTPVIPPANAVVPDNTLTKLAKQLGEAGSTTKFASISSSVCVSIVIVVIIAVALYFYLS